MSDGAQLVRERKAWEQGNRDLLRQEERKKLSAQRKIDVTEAVRNDEIKKKIIDRITAWAKRPKKRIW